LTQSQNILLPHIREDNLCAIHRVLKTLGWDALGFESGVDVTACPGTDTCNLAIANSTHLATELEHLLEEEFPHVIQDRTFSVKISGCMNACGQHTMASVGLHGSSIRKDGVVIPAMQILVGGGRRQDGSWRFGKKVIKLPTRRIPEAIRMLLIDHESHQRPHETFADHVESMGDRYFYNLLLPLADVQHAEDHALRIDWGSDTPFVPEIGVGECAGVVIDLVSTLLLEAHEKFEAAEGALSTESWGHAVYHTYAAYIAGAKAVLIQRDLPTNSYADIMAAFDEQVVATGEITLPAGSFTAQTLSYLGGGNRPEFARAFADDCRVFLGDLQRLTAHTNSTQSKAS
jgi:sulfite reductase (ferredoxin)